MSDVVQVTCPQGQKREKETSDTNNLYKTTLDMNNKTYKWLKPCISESDSVSDDAKELLNKLIAIYCATRLAKEHKKLIVGNTRLMNELKWSSYRLQLALSECLEFGFFTRDAGKKWKEGEKRVGSTYVFNRTALTTPPAEKSLDEAYDEMFGPEEQPKMELEQPYIPMTYEQAPEYGKVEHQASEVELEGVHAGDFFGLVKGFPSDIEELTPEQATKVCDYRDFTLNTSDEKEAFECFLDDMYGEGALNDIRRIAIDGVKHQINVERERARKQLADDCLEMGMIGLN